VFFVNRGGRPIWWNRYAAEVLAASDGLWLDAAGFRTSLPAEAHRLAGLIRTAAMPDRESFSRGGAMAISRPSLRRRYAVLVSPLGTASRPQSQAVAAVLVTDPERNLVGGSGPRLAAQFRLTAAEAKVAALLVQGSDVASIAEALSIRVATVRTHVRNLLHKTSTTRQSELIRVLLSGPSLLDV
jgi:DNA-binding CsgD family transcriptional regulator